MRLLCQGHKVTVLLCSELVALELVKRLSPASAAVSAQLLLPDSGGIELRLDAVPTLLNTDLPATRRARYLTPGC